MIDNKYRWIGEFATAFTFFCLWVGNYLYKTYDNTVVCATVIATTTLLQSIESDKKDLKNDIMIYAYQISNKFYKSIFIIKYWIEKVVSILLISLILSYVITLTNVGVKFDEIRTLEIWGMIICVAVSHIVFLLISLLMKSIVSVAMDKDVMRSMQQ